MAADADPPADTADIADTDRTDPTDLVVGLHAATALLQANPERASVVLIQRGRRDRRIGAVMDLARAAGVRLQVRPRQALDRLHGGPHQGVVVRLQRARALDQSDLEAWLEQAAEPFLLVLDGVEDPRNLGACLRTADAAGVDAVIVPRSRSASLGAAAYKSASGALEHVPVYSVPNLARALRSVASFGVRIIGAADDAPCSWCVADYRGPLAIVLGGEAAGLRRLTRQACDELVAIPMQGRVSSLNVSVAAGVLLFEALRQRQLASLASAP